MEQKNLVTSYQYGEGRTVDGQLVKFSCPSEMMERVKDFLKTNIKNINIPTTGRVNVGHGGYGQYTRYDITQHKYAGGGHPGCGGYIEVLEIKNPPDGRWGIVINENLSPQGGVFTEWATLENALAVFEKSWCSIRTETELIKFPGFKRRIVCNALTPWFYAIGDEELIGDYAFPEGLQDDPVFRFGKQFVVFDSDKIPAIKTCMGTRFLQRKERDYPHKEYKYRLVYWDDGSVWDESKGSGGSPRPVEEGEMWITEAVQQFRQLLASKSAEFTINFTDGNRFVGKLMKANRRAFCEEGDYFLVIQLKGIKKPLEGWVNDFKPSKDVPDVVQYTTQRYARNGKKVERIEVKERKTKKNGKKWGGVFFSP